MRTPWGPAERKKWFEQQIVQRSYKDEVVARIDGLRNQFEVTAYGALSLDYGRYPLFLLKSRTMDGTKATILITGGVHGYETSGVHGALEFMQMVAHRYSNKFNFICAPCISPWGYETVNRWNPEAIDPNRSFKPESSVEECSFFLNAMSSNRVQPTAHFDLHETTDTDNSVFRPALEQRDGVVQELWEIPDGFYLVGDTENPQREFQRAIIASVKKVTHIAPHDSQGKIIGVSVEQEGVINYPLKKLSLCAGFSNAKFTTTTEVYPDSPKVTPQNCIEAQVAAVVGGLDYLLNTKQTGS